MSLPSQPFATHEPEVKGRAQPEREPQRQRRLAAAPLTPARVAVATGAGVARHDQLGGHQPPPSSRVRTCTPGRSQPGYWRVNGRSRPTENPEEPQVIGALPVLQHHLLKVFAEEGNDAPPSILG